jgi:hypothetical protein
MRTARPPGARRLRDAAPGASREPPADASRPAQPRSARSDRCLQTASQRHAVRNAQTQAERAARRSLRGASSFAPAAAHALSRQRGGRVARRHVAGRDDVHHALAPARRGRRCCSSTGGSIHASQSPRAAWQPAAACTRQARLRTRAGRGQYHQQLCGGAVIMLRSELSVAAGTVSREPAGVAARVAAWCKRPPTRRATASSLLPTMKATQLCPPAPRPPPTAHGGHLRRRHHAAPAAGAAWSARLRGQHALRTPQQRFLAAPPQPRPPRAAARLPAGGARDGAAATPAFGAQAAQQATRRQQAVHRHGLAARFRVSASARRRTACVRSSARHSACSASASVAAPRCSCRRPVRPSQPPASLRRRSCLAHVHRLQARAAKTATSPPPSPPPRLSQRRQQPPLPARVASSAPRTRREALSIGRLRGCTLRAVAFASAAPARSSAASTSRRRLLHGTAAPHLDAQPQASPIRPPRPPRPSQAGTARQRAQPPTQASRSAPVVRAAPRRSRRPRLARPRHSCAAPHHHQHSRAPSRVVETLSRKSTAASGPRTGSTSPAIGTAVAEPSELCTSAVSVAPAAQHAWRELRSPASSQPCRRRFQSLAFSAHRAANTRSPPSSTTQQTPLPVPATASPRCHDARRAQLL